MTYKPDPRTNFILVFFLTTIILFFSDIKWQLLVMATTLVISKLLGVELIKVYHRLRHFLILMVGILVIQSLFRSDGQAIVQIGGIRLLTDQGLTMAVGYLCRVVVIIFSGAIISTSTLRQNLQGLNQLGIPYELALMTGVGIRFLPMLMEEVNNAYMAMELRGVDINALPIKKRIALVSQLFIPIIYGTIVRAHKLSESIEARGFGIGQKRTSYYRLKMARHDWLVVGIGCVLFGLVVFYGM